MVLRDGVCDGRNAMDATGWNQVKWPSVLLLLGCQGVWGQNPQSQKSSQSSPNDLTQVSIEDRMSMEVTSVSKKEQKMLQVAAAIFVISQEDIRHSGATNIPDLLRIVPGLDVVWDTNLYFVDHLPAQLIPSYARLDTMLRWRFAEHLELTAVGQNLIRD